MPELLPRLNRWFSYLREQGLYDPRGPFLPTRNRTPMKFQFVHRLVVRVGERAGLDRRLTPHTLRRTFGSDLLNRGLRIEVVSKLLGHSNVAVTQKAYAVLLDGAVKSELPPRWTPGDNRPLPHEFDEMSDAEFEAWERENTFPTSGG